MNRSKEMTQIIAGGLVIGVIASLLVFFGNPSNMGFCIACFLRDTAGALGLHQAAPVQYIRPEIIGIVLGSTLLALAGKEFSPRGGSSPMTRFILGFFVMIGCLMFLGCPFRMIVRLAGGDLNALFGFLGFFLGILTGVFFLNSGYSLRRTYRLPALEGGILPAVEIVFLILLVAAPAFIHFTEAGGGPGAKHAALLISLAAGLIVGAIAQKTRLCMVGGIRDIILFREYRLICGFAAILVSALVCNLILSCRRIFPPGSCETAGCAYRRTLECAWHVSRRIRLRPSGRLPAPPAGYGRRRKFRQHISCVRTDGRSRICT